MKNFRRVVSHFVGLRDNDRLMIDEDVLKYVS